MVIKILGTGCKKCDNLTKNAKAAIEQLGLAATVEKVEDFKEIMKYGVMQTPALVVDEVVKSYGKELSTAEVVKILQK